MSLLEEMKVAVREDGEEVEEWPSGTGPEPSSLGSGALGDVACNHRGRFLSKESPHRFPHFLLSSPER